MRKIEEIETPPFRTDVTFYQEMYESQAKLVENFVESKRQPPWPMDLNTRPSQQFMRDLIGFLEEELIEGYERIEELTRDYQRSDRDPKEVKDLVVMFNEEQADCLALFIEVLQYSNIDVISLEEYYKQYLTLAGFKGKITQDPLKMAFFHAQLNNGAFYRKGLKFRLMDSDSDITTGGCEVSNSQLEVSQRQLFQVTKYLRLATNLLKNKYWKETDTEVNMEKFHEYIMEAWLYYFLFLESNGFTRESVRGTFMRKNIINLERIANKY